MERLQWLEERRRGVGGSDVAAIMGMSPWKTAFRVYQEKRKEVEDWNGNELTDWGKRMEPAIRQWYSDTTGRSVRLPENIMYNEKHPFMFASLDGFTEDGRIVEIKTARSGKQWGEPGTNQIPDYYLLQCQHYMAVTGMDVTDVPVSIAGGAPELYEVPANAELQALIIEAETAFWERVIKGVPPVPVCYADAVQMFGQSDASGVLIASDDHLNDVKTINVIRGQIEELEAKEKEIKGRLIIALGDKYDTIVGTDDKAIVTYRLANGRKTFDTKIFEKDHPNLYQKYLKKGEPQRRFLIK